jgi:hypothetical protein
MKMWKSLGLCLLLAALWATDSWTPSASASPGAGLICSFETCTGTGSCICPGIRQLGHCVNGACTL